MSSGRNYTWLWVLGGIGAGYLLGRAALRTEMVRNWFSLPDPEQAHRIRELYNAASPEARREIDDFYREIGQSRPF